MFHIHGSTHASPNSKKPEPEKKDKDAAFKTEIEKEAQPSNNDQILIKFFEFWDGFGEDYMVEVSKNALGVLILWCRWVRYLCLCQDKMDFK